MRRITTLAVIAALALPASAGAAVKTYGGKIEGGGRIGIDVRLARGVPKEVEALTLKRFPYQCTGSGAVVLNSVITALNLTVADKKFGIDATDTFGNHLLFKGKFRQRGSEIAGRLQRTVTGVDPGDQTCTSKTRDYSVVRGAPAP
jgi:hypothetical protein